MLKSTYPILCVTMNKVSDLKLALACHAACIVPSLSVYSNTEFVENSENYYNNEAINELDEFIEKTSSNEISFAFQANLLHNDSFFNQILKSKNRLIEIIDWRKEDIKDNKILDRIISLQSQNKKVGLKINTNKLMLLRNADPRNLILLVDYYLLKGSEGAGQVGLETIDDLTAGIRKESSKDLIATGGVSTSADINRLISIGANAVGIGTLFAMSEESRIPKEVKLSLLEKTKNDIIKVNGTHRGIMFSHVEEHSNDNLDKSLVRGIETGKEGHINMGNAILNINKVLPLKDIVSLLVKDLK